MCGIKIDGENHFTIAPKDEGKSTYANAEYDSVYGRGISSWRMQDGKTVFTVTIPINTSADIILPNGIKQNVTEREYIYEKTSV